MNVSNGNEPSPSPTPGDGATRAMDGGESTVELAQVLDAYLVELEHGRPPNRAELLAAHPHLAAQLEPALAGLEFIHQAQRRAGQVPIQLGDFRVLREVGCGGMGVVYEAEQVSLKRRVALKVLRFGGVADELAMRRFQREAETVARLHHTNIVPIFAVGSAEGVPYYAMQFIEGQDLAARVKVARDTGAAIPAREIADWGLQAAEALAHAHQRGVIHRDIKPSNLICDPEGRIWLTDFGLARRVDDAGLSVVGALLGTPRYMSPEQARAAAQPVDHRTDLYSLGATLYELATCRPIFEAATAQEVIAQILHSEPRPPRTLAPELPRDLETIILKCIAKEPRDRYASAPALAEDLRAFLAGRPLATRQPGWFERTVRWVRQHRRVVTAAGVSAGLATALVVGGWLAWQANQRARLGHVFLTTSGPNILAEVLDATGRGITPVFPVPTPEPVPLQAGNYHLRLSAPGMLSETWPLEVHQGQLDQRSVALRPNWLWPPKEINTAESPEIEIVALDGAADLLVLTHATVTGGTPRYERRLQRVRGATGESTWARPLRFDDTSLPAGAPTAEWQNLLAPGIGSSFKETGIADRAQDLDGDGTRDVVLLSRHSPSLTAVSGRTGAVLWWCRVKSPPPPTMANGSPQFQSSGRGAVVGLPVVADVDGDNIPDFITCVQTGDDLYRTPEGGQQRTGARSWITVVSGKTGALKWQQPVAGRWEQYANSSTEREKYDALCRPAVAQVAGRTVVVLLDNTQLPGWDAETGSPAWPPIELGFAPTLAPDLADLDGDGNAEALLLRERQDQTGRDLVALALPAGTPAWSRPVRSTTRQPTRYPAPIERSVQTPEDLDGDGRPELLAFTSDRPLPGTHLFGLELMDGATGRSRWTQRLGLSRTVGDSPGVQQVVSGPDLNGDGVRELLATWHAPDEATARAGAWVAALSGRTGAALWRVHLPEAHDVRTLAWWQVGADGWPLLLVGLQHAGAGQRMTHVLAGGSGHLEHVLRDVADPQVADFNGDGIPDLYYTVSPQGAPRQLVVRGAPPEVWRRLGGWQAAQDFDGDHETDFVGRADRRLLARSGRNGQPLWQTEFELQDEEPTLLPHAPSHDLDGDGVPDLVTPFTTWRPTNDGGRSSYRSLAAWSGKDGRQLWLAKDWEFTASGESGGRIGWSFDYPALAWSEPSAGDTPGLLVAHRDSNEVLRLTRLEGRSGQPRWSLPMIRGAFGPAPSPGGPPMADFNGDGVADAALWSPEPSEQANQVPCRLKLFDGRTGQVGWSSPTIAVADEWRVIWPEALVADLDGDGSPEVLVARHQDYNGETAGYPCELIAADGRTGQIRWVWTWRSGFPDVWPPLVLAAGTRGAQVVLAVRETGFDGLVVLDGNGQVQMRRPLSLTRNSLDAGRLVWRTADLDADGRRELVYLDNEHVCVAEGENLKVRWRWPVSGELAMLLAPQPGSSGQPGSLPIWSGRDVFGLDATTGTPVWRGRVSGEPTRAGSRVPVPQLIRTSRPDGLARLQFLVPGHAFGQDATVVSQTWPATSVGRYAAPRPTPVPLLDLPEAALPGRPWPWAKRLGWTMAFLSGALSLALLALPMALAAWAIGRRSWRLAFLPVAYSGASVLLFQQGPAALAAVGCAVWLAVRSWQAGKRSLAALAVVHLTLCGLPFVAIAANHPLRDLHPWGAWWWADEVLVEPLVITLVGSPTLFFWNRLWHALRRRDGWQLVRWLAWALLAGLALAAILLWVDSPDRLPQEKYAWRGWYGVGLIGAYAAGLLGLLALGWRRVRDALRRREVPGPPSVQRDGGNPGPHPVPLPSDGRGCPKGG